MIVNPVFIKSGKVLNSSEKQKNRSQMSQIASQETQTSDLFKRREIFWTCAKKPAKSLGRVYSDKWQLSLEQKLNKNHFGSFIQGLNLLGHG